MRNLELLELEELSIKPMSLSEMTETEGGILLGLAGTALKMFEFVVEEVADFVVGVYDGFTHFVK